MGDFGVSEEGAAYKSIDIICCQSIELIVIWHHELAATGQ
jgi:hypothetical protein